jgi:hypothetical protein
MEIIEALRTERRKLAEQLSALDTAIEAYVGTGRVRLGRTMSLSARRKIGAAVRPKRLRKLVGNEPPLEH